MSKKENNKEKHEVISETDNSISSAETSAAENIQTDKNGKRTYILEAVLAVAAVAILAAAVFLYQNQKKNNADSLSASADSVSSSSANTAVSVSIDNSILFTDAPSVPDASAFNTLTEADCEKAVSDGTMLKLETDSSETVYVQNYTDSDYFAENTAYTSEEVDDAIFDNVLVNYGEEQPSDHEAAVSGDTVDIDYVGTIDGVAFEGGSNNDQLLLGSGSYIPGFEDGIIGMKAGETKDITVTFPEDYFEESLAGKEAVFSISLNEIMSTTVYPEELTEEIVKEAHPELNSVEECRDYYEKMVLEEKIWNFIASDFYVSSIPNAPVMNYYEQTMKYYDTLSNSYQTSIESLLSANGQSVDDFKNTVMNSSTQQSRYSVLYNALLPANNITITADDYTELATAYGYDDVDEFMDSYGKQSIDDYISQKKLLDALADKRLAAK